MANIKEIKVGNTIYNVKDKDAITKIKIGNNTYYEPIDGLVSLPEGIGGSYNTDAEARAAIILLNSRLADLAFNDQGRPTIDFNVQYFNVNVRTEGLINCSAIIPQNVNIPAGSDFTIRIIANTGYALPNITTDNLKTEQGTQEINWNQSGYEDGSHTIYKIVFSTVTKEINLSIKNITAEVSVSNKITISCNSNNFGSWTSDPDIKVGGTEYNKNEQVTVTFTPADNYEFKTSSVNVYVHGQEDLIVTKDMIGNKLKVVVKNPENTIFFDVNPLYKHYITQKTLTNCTLSPSLPDYILHGEEKTVQVVATSTSSETYTMDGGIVSVIPNNYATYDSSTHFLTIHPTETEQPIQIMASAKLVQGEQPVTQTAKITLKLLNVTPGDGSGFSNTVTTDNPFGYYVKTVNTSNTFSVDLNTDSGATNNNDLKVIGVSTENEAIILQQGDSGYELNGSTLSINSTILESYKEIVISNTAHTNTITFTCEQGLETYETVYIKWGNNSNDITETQLHGGDNNIDCTGKGIITSMYTKFNGYPTNHLKYLGPFLLSVDFGGHQVGITTGQLFSACSKLTSVEGLIIGPQTTTIASWFVGCTKLHKIDTIGWDLSNVTQIQAAFSNCTKGTLSLDLDFMDVRKVEKVFVYDNTHGALSGTFSLSKFDTLSLRYWNINGNNNTPMNLSAMFTGMTLLGTDRTLDLSTFKVHNLTSLHKTFMNNSSSAGTLSIDIRGLETLSQEDPNHEEVLQDMSYMLSGTNLKCLYVGNLNADYTDLNISNIRGSGDKITKIQFTYSEPLSYNHNEDKDWINALICDDSNFHTTLAFGEDGLGTNWYSGHGKTTFIINRS